MANQEKMSPVTPYLTVRGAADAIAFYTKAFGATENARMPAPDGKRLIHADITINGGRVLMSDEFPEHSNECGGALFVPTPDKPVGVAIALHYAKPAEIDATFRRAVKAGCKSVQEPAGYVLGCALRHAQRPVRASLDVECAAAGEEDVERTRVQERIAMLMTAQTEPISNSVLVSNRTLWAGRILSGLVVAFLLFDGAIKLIPLDIVVQTSQELGIPVHLARTLGVLTIACALLYAIPRTSVLGAILLTGYLGGAVYTHVQAGSPLFTPPAVRRLSRRDGLGRPLSARWARARAHSPRALNSALPTRTGEYS